MEQSSGFIVVKKFLANQTKNCVEKCKALIYTKNQSNKEHKDQQKKFHTSCI